VIVVCGGIQMSDSPSFPYELPWRQKRICSAANLTRRDRLNLLVLASHVPVRTEVEVLSLAQANNALRRLRAS
jgi:alcohol dehydrogenase, propanol-preferring